ncbi:MAG: type IV pilin N-terminal domain-containing protein [Candidatus Hadarchaeales archaeon]
MEGRRGVSPVVAVVLLTSITVIAAGSITCLLGQFLQMSPPVNSEIRLSGAAAGSTEFSIIHEGGETIQNAISGASWGDLEVRINGVPIGMENIRFNGAKVTGDLRLEANDVINYSMVGQEDGGTPSGSGTPDDPYIIKSVEHIKSPDTMESLFGSDFLKKHFALGCDIDANGFTIDSISKPGSGEEFTGSFDGRGHVIKNLVIRGTSSSGGFIGGIGTAGIIKDIGLENVRVIGGQSAGALVGANYGTVTRCYATGVVEGTSSVGGLVGTNSGTGKISESYSLCKVTGNTHTGGLVGWNAGSIENCYSAGTVDGNGGGLVGKSQDGTVKNSFWDMETSGKTTSAGGTGKTTAQMKDVSTFTNPSQSPGLTTPWDFVGNPPVDTGTRDIWTIIPGVNSGYPALMNPGFVARLGLRPGDVITIIYRPANQLLVQYTVP